MQEREIKYMIMKMNLTKFALSFEKFEIKIAFQIKHDLDIIFTFHS